MLGKNRGTSIAPRARDDATDLGPWGPNTWFDEMDRWFDDVRREFEGNWGRWPLAVRMAALPSARMPALDLRDNGAEIVVTADLPGVSKEDLEIHAMPDRLEIRAEVQRAREQKDEDFLYRGRKYSAFGRTLALPAEVVPDKIMANPQGRRPGGPPAEAGADPQGEARQGEGRVGSHRFPF